MLPPLARWLLAALVLVGLARPAGALQFDVLGDRGGTVVIVAEGTIEQGDAAQLSNLLARIPRVDEVVIASAGGNLSEGLALGRLIRARRLATRIAADSICASACVHVFSGGVLRTVERGALVIVHMASVSDMAEIQQATILSTRRGIETTVEAIQALEQLGAVGAAEQAAYFQQMGISGRIMGLITETTHNDARPLSLLEIRDLNLANTLD